jgi:hypothetical protein
MFKRSEPGLCIERKRPGPPLLARRRARIEAVEQRARRRDERVRPTGHTEEGPPHRPPSVRSERRHHRLQPAGLLDPVERRRGDGEIEDVRGELGVLERDLANLHELSERSS